MKGKAFAILKLHIKYQGCVNLLSKEAPSGVAAPVKLSSN